MDHEGTERLTWLYSQTKSPAQSSIISMDVKTQTTGKHLTATAVKGVV